MGNILVDSYSESNYSVDFYMYLSDNRYALQSFSVSSDVILSNIKVWLKKTEASPGYLDNASVYGVIYAHTGTYGTDSKPGTGASWIALSGNANGSSISTSYTLFNFTFSGGNRIALHAGTKYIVGFTSNTYGTVDNYFDIGLDTTSPAASGNFSYGADGTNWTADNKK